MKIVFMGTPEFAVPTLTSLIQSSHEISAVYTRPPKPAGRGGKITQSPIHILSTQNDLRVFTPKNFKETAAIEEFTNLQADIAVVVAYGVLLPKSILTATKYGAINIHPSKLPRWRGAAPIQRAILAGDDEAAITIMQLDEGMDTGDILLSKDIKIEETYTAKDLHDITAKIGAKLVLEALDKIESGDIIRTKQAENGMTLAEKITKDDEKINWQQSAKLVHRQIMGLSPKPGAYFQYNGENIKILLSEFAIQAHNYLPGTVVDEHLSIACINGFLKPKLLKREGRKEIYCDAFLRGYNIPIGTAL